MPHYEYKITTGKQLYDEWRRVGNFRVGTEVGALNDLCTRGWRLVAVDGQTWYLERWVDE